MLRKLSIICVLVSAALPLVAQQGAKNGEWRSYAAEQRLLLPAWRQPSEPGSLHRARHHGVDADLRSTSSAAQVRPNERIAAFDAAYAPNAGTPAYAAVEPANTIEAPSLRRGSTSWTVNTVPPTLRFSVSSRCSGVSSARVANSPPPALAKTTSSPRRAPGSHRRAVRGRRRR